MALGGQRPEEEFEWVDLADLPDDVVPDAGERQPLADALCDWFERHPVWARDDSTRLLLVDLDNLRAAPRRWRARIAVALWLGRRADHVLMAGQHSALERARPYLAELEAHAVGVDDGSDVADHVLLDAAQAVPAGRLQVVVLSNDGIFVRLAALGPLTVVSPGGDALSDRLREAAVRVVVLSELEDAALLGAAQGR